MMKPFVPSELRPVEITDPLTFWESTAAWTWLSDTSPGKLTVNSVPPAKSIPRAKCFVAIEMMPGTMMISDSAKNQLRLPIRLRRRGGFGSDAGARTSASCDLACWTISATCSSAETSDSSDTIHPEHARTPEPAACEHDGEQVVSDDDR